MENCLTMENFGVDIETKFRNLRSTYYWELEKMEKSIHSETECVYKPKVKWFHAIDGYIKNVIKNKFMDHSTYDIQNEKIANHVNNYVYQPPRKESMVLPIPLQPTKPNYYNTPKMENMTANTNEFDVFGKYVTIQLGKMAEEDAIKAQEEIQSVLCRHRLRNMSNTFNFNNK